MDIVKIETKRIHPDSEQPRKHFDAEKIKELSYSIQKYGLLQPVLVRRDGDDFILIAGERRFRACCLLKFEFVDAIIKDDADIQEIALIENIQREDLNAVEEAEAILSLKQKKNYTHEDIAKVLGKTRSYVTNKLRILSLDDRSRKFLEEKKISEGHAKALLSEKDIKKRDEIVDKILSDGLSVRDVESLVKKPKKKKSAFDEEVESAINLLEDTLCTKVSVRKAGDESGSIVVDFYSYEQLRDIVEFIIGER